MKRVVVALMLAGALVSSCGKAEEPDAGWEKIPAQEETAEAAEATGPSKEELRQAFQDRLGASCAFSALVRGDKTGTWRMLRYSAGVNFADYAADYYAAYFESDDEVHAVVDLTHATYMITYSYGILNIAQHAYVDGEEHDAALLGSGDLIAQYTVDLSTGAVEKL